MKNLWRRAAGKIKDRNSIWMSSLTRKSKHRHPDLEAAMIQATSHDDSSVDYKNAQRVFTWVRTSPFHLMAFLWALTRRMERTRDWAVVLKGLILLHGVLCTKAPGVRKIGRLPFDISSFEGRGKPRRRARNEFVLAYFAFVDLKSVIMSAELKDEMAAPMLEEERDGPQMLLVRVQRWQDLLDAALEVRPSGGGILEEIVVLEAMDCMVIEVFELYSKICDGIANTLVKIYKDKASKAEASMALNVLQKASRQGKDLSYYFQFCRKTGLLHATECPKVQQIPEEDFSELKRIMDGDKENYEGKTSKENNSRRAMIWVDEKKGDDHQVRNNARLKTLITDKWEVFDEDMNEVGNGGLNPFPASLSLPPDMQFNPFID